MKHLLALLLALTLGACYSVKPYDPTPPVPPDPWVEPEPRPDPHPDPQPTGPEIPWVLAMTWDSAFMVGVLETAAVAPTALGPPHLVSTGVGVEGQRILSWWTRDNAGVRRRLELRIVDGRVATRPTIF